MILIRNLILKVVSSRQVMSLIENIFWCRTCRSIGTIQASEFTKAKTKLVEGYGGADNPEYQSEKEAYFWNPTRGKMRSKESIQNIQRMQQVLKAGSKIFR